MKPLFVYASLTLFICLPLGASADLQGEYSYEQYKQQDNRISCSEMKRKGNYTREGGGSWEPEIYVDGNTVYRATPNQSCAYEWTKVGVIDKQIDSTYRNGMDGTCTESLLFKKTRSDLLSFKKNNCFTNETNGVEKVCYVPIDWNKGERKYPYCGCFDTPVPSWLTSSGYCKNASFGGFMRNLLFGK